MAHRGPRVIFTAGCPWSRSSARAKSAELSRGLWRRARAWNLVRLIDEKAAVAAGKALDLMQAGPICRSDTRVEGSADLAAASGAAAIVIADRVDSADEWGGEQGLDLLRRLGRGGFLDRSVVICAGASQRALMQQGFDELGLPRRRVIGSAPEALAATARALVAIEARAASNQVALTVIGRPDKFVIPWSDASVGGHALTTSADSAAAESGRTAAERPLAAGHECAGHCGCAVLRGSRPGIATHRERIRVA